MIDENFRNQMYAWMDAVQRTAPLVHSITNYVTVNDCANALLAIGARPVMSHDPREAAEITRGSQALELNLGATEYIDAMFLSGQAAREKGIPRVIDPVGISGSTFRRETLHRMIAELQPTAIRGNYSEIHALLANAGTGTGVDAVVDAAHPALSGDALARGMQDYLRTLDFPMILVASGREDIIASRDALCFVKNGSPRMSRVTGTGCMATELLAAFLAVADGEEEKTLQRRTADEEATFVGGNCGSNEESGDACRPKLSCEAAFRAAVLATAFMGIAGEIAEESAPRGSGSYHIALIDALSTMTAEDIVGRISLRESFL